MKALSRPAYRSLSVAVASRPSRAPSPRCVCPRRDNIKGGSSSSSSSSRRWNSSAASRQKPPFRFETGQALFAKRNPRPFPPPFLSPPSGSFSDPLSTHHQSRDRRLLVNGQLIKGETNGDDAVYASERFIGANDGVGAWSTRPRGHAGLWSRLVLHFWATAVEEDAIKREAAGEYWEPEPIRYLQRAFEQTIKATSEPNDWLGTTTASGAQIHYKAVVDGSSSGARRPVVYITNLGDCQVMVLRPKDREVLFKTTEQWHWFDCPRQLGTNSPDTPEGNADVHVVDVECGDVVLAMTDGVIDNLWEHEIVDVVSSSISEWESGARSKPVTGANGRMGHAAAALMEAARKIAQDPFAESPYMEHAIDEGLASEGGKPDDISVVAALCVKNE